ncbi:MAG TPA: CoA-binding protein [Aquifex aeolicus]|nr:CoA-binding protein [Aquifex aeolicus]
MAEIQHADEALEVLKNAKVIAVIGISPKPERPSYYTTEKVIKKGKYKIYLINPRYAGQEIFGIKVLPSLRDVPETIDIVNVYRNPAHAEEVIKESIEVGAKCVWFQLGAENPEVIEKYKDKIKIIYNACIGVEVGYL